MITTTAARVAFALWGLLHLATFFSASLRNLKKWAFIVHIIVVIVIACFFWMLSWQFFWILVLIYSLTAMPTGVWKKGGDILKGRWDVRLFTLVIALIIEYGAYGLVCLLNRYGR